MKERKTFINDRLKSVQVDTDVSAKIIQQLQRKGMSLSQIGKLMDLSKSFVSRVKNGERSLTISRLSKLEEKLNLPLPLLFLGAIETQSMPNKLKKQYEALRNAFIKSADLSKELLGIQ